MGLTNAELGLVLTTVAGSATALGAAVVFSERLVQLASKPFLAGALGLSSGVMLYVSFVEIFVKSLDGFADSSAFGDSDAYLMATAALFGGMAFMSALDALVHWLDPNRSAHHASDPRKHMVRFCGVLFVGFLPGAASMAWGWCRIVCCRAVIGHPNDCVTAMACRGLDGPATTPPPLLADREGTERRRAVRHRRDA